MPGIYDRSGEPHRAQSWNDNRNNGARPPQSQPHPIVPQKVPADYVDKAEQVMQRFCKGISTSKLRNLLSLVSDAYNMENIRTEEKILPETEVKLNLMRIRVVYECGRENGKSLKEFISEAKILEYLKGIQGDREDLIRFAHYMEALVAYHRYYDGKEY